MDLYRGFDILPKRDFGPHGFWNNGCRVDRGFVVVKDSINVMPGATWFQTLTQAFDAIDDWLESGQDPATFWAKQRARPASVTPSLSR